MFSRLKEKIQAWLYEQSRVGRDLYFKSEMIFEESKLNSSGIQFKLYKASGGFVVEIDHPSQDIDNSSNLYIITNTDDLGQSLAKIVTLENLIK